MHEANSQPVVQNKDKDKINNILNDTVTRKTAFGVNPDAIKPVLRRWTETSEGDMIFHKDDRNKYLTETMTKLDRNNTMKLESKAVSRKR